VYRIATDGIKFHIINLITTLFIEKNGIKEYNVIIDMKDSGYIVKTVLISQEYGCTTKLDQRVIIAIIRSSSCDRP